MSIDPEWTSPVADISNQSVSIWSKPDPDAPSEDRNDPDASEDRSLKQIDASQRDFSEPSQQDNDSRDCDSFA